MPKITIDSLDEEAVARLRARAAKSGRSLGEEARHILCDLLASEKQPDNIGEAIHSHFKHLGGVDLELPTREPMREPPTFD